MIINCTNYLEKKLSIINFILFLLDIFVLTKKSYETFIQIKIILQLTLIQPKRRKTEKNYYKK